MRTILHLRRGQKHPLFVLPPRPLVWCLIMLSIALIAQYSHASAQTPPPPTTLSTVAYSNVAVLNQVEVVQEVIDFAPGAWTPVLSRGGDLFVTVAEGQVTLRKGDFSFYHAATASTRTFRINRDEKYALGNENGVAKARIYTSTLLPPGASLTVLQGETGFPAPVPTVVMTSRATSPLPAGLVSVVQVVWDFEPGAATPSHTHHGFFLVTVVDGALGRLTVADGKEQIYRTGESFTEATGREWDAIVRNVSGGRTRNFFTVLATQLPPSTNLPAAAAPITAPRTGDAGLVVDGDRLISPLAVAILLLTMLGGAIGLRRVVARRA
jgi:quercetin dioxygenase-like cupin family protein